MNQNNLKFLYTAAIILGLCAFTPPRKCVSPCRGSVSQKECATDATATGATDLISGSAADKEDSRGSCPHSAPGQKKAIAPDGSKELPPGQQAVTTEREEIPADSPFLVALYV